MTIIYPEHQSVAIAAHVAPCICHRESQREARGSAKPMIANMSPRRWEKVLQARGSQFRALKRVFVSSRSYKSSVRRSFQEGAFAELPANELSGGGPVVSVGSCRGAGTQRFKAPLESTSVMGFYVSVCCKDGERIQTNVCQETEKGLRAMAEC